MGMLEMLSLVAKADILQLAVMLALDFSIHLKQTLFIASISFQKELDFSPSWQKFSIYHPWQADLLTWLYMHYKA